MPASHDTPPGRGFAAGTRIFTARGEVAVEALRPGDLLVTLSGRGAPLKPLRAVHIATGDAVRLDAGALGAGIPARDLTLGAAQALRVEGMLLPARRLVNGTTIRAEPSLPLHLPELDQPDLLIAAGTPAAALPDAPEAAPDPARLAAIHATLAARGAAPLPDPRDALLDGLIAGEEALSARATLQAGAAPDALGGGEFGDG